MISVIDEKLRPWVADRHKAWLRVMADDRSIFDKQLDAWAFSAAYAMKNDLSTIEGEKRAEMPQIMYLDDSLTEVLLFSLQRKLPESTTWESKEVLNALSMYANAGLDKIRPLLEGKTERDRIYSILFDL